MRYVGIFQQSPRRAWLRHAALAFGIAALAVAAVTSQDGIDAIRELSLGRIAAILALAGSSTISAAATWKILMPSAPSAIEDYLVIQGSKYLPLGGAAHGIGMALSAAKVGIRPRLGLARFLMHAAYHLVAALAVASSLAYGAPAVVRLACAIAIAVGGSVFVARVCESRGYLIGGWGVGVRCALTSLVSVTTSGFAFGLVIDSGRAFDLIPSFSLAWAVGFVAVPLPAGIVLRESVLAALGVGSIAQVAAASLLHRTLGVIADASLAGAAVLALRRGKK